MRARVPLTSAVIAAGLTLAGAKLASVGAAPPPASFADAVRAARPAVVYIFSAQHTQRAKGGQPGDPFEEFFRGFFGEEPPQPRPQRSLGTGFIISPDGYIVTNAHVVADSESIQVKLADKKVYKAKLIGSDAKTDVALIKIDSPEPFTAVPLGASAALEVGDWVIAIGNPFGLEQTVTAGIVSAKGRVIGAGPYDDFIQTDASINPGNSGGPLLNTAGQVVGINSAIFSRSGGNIGIGFAIPIDLAQHIVSQLKSDGKVTRGWLGVALQDVTQDLAKSLGLEEASGTLVADVTPGSPAAEAGIERGDVIVEFEGKRVGDTHTLPALVAETPIGKRVTVKLLRNGRSRSVEISIATSPEEPAPQARATSEATWGFSVTELTPALARRRGIPKDIRGVVVSDVLRGGPAAEAGLDPGDVIRDVNRRPITSVAEFRRQLAKADDRVLLLVQRGRASAFIVVQR